MEKKTKITISDVAAAAGVSKTTVSRYINGREDLMSEKTRDKIKTIIGVSNYTPSAAAQSLKTKNTRQIGVLFSDMSTPFSAALAAGIGEFLEKAGYDPLYANADQNRGKEDALIDMFSSKNVAGLLVNSTSNNNKKLIKIDCDGLPVVLCDRYINDYRFNIVTLEQEKTMHKLIEHLMEQGYTRPLLFSQMIDENSTRIRRKNAFLASVKEVYGYSAEEDVYIISKRNNISAAAQLEIALSKYESNEKIAIIGTNSDTTVKVYKALRDKNLSIPKDVGLCGPEDWDWESEMNWPTLLNPTITTIYVPTRLMGYKSAEMIVDIIENGDRPPREIVLPCELKIRESTNLRKYI